MGDYRGAGRRDQQRDPSLSARSPGGSIAGGLRRMAGRRLARVRYLIAKRLVGHSAPLAQILPGLEPDSRNFY